MSEKNYINESVVPRMPKSVSNEQLFVFVPVATASVAGIFKIDINDFDTRKLPVLKIVESPTIDVNNASYNAKGYVRAGNIAFYVNNVRTELKNDIDNLKNTKQDEQDNNLQTVNKNVVGAINELNDKIGDDNSGLTKRVGDLEKTVGNSTTGLVQQVKANRDAIASNAKAIQKNSDDIGTLQKSLDSTNKNVNNLDGRVTGLAGTKQDKAININGIAAKTVEGALSELDTESSRHTKDITDLLTVDGKLTKRIENLEQSAYSGETPIGTLDSGVASPNDIIKTTILTQFVVNHTDPSREPKIGDVILYTQIITGDTDKSYKFMYTLSGWTYYVIPTVETASNTDKGIVQGTLGDTSGNYQVSIVAGKVADILVKDGTTYKSIKTLLDTFATKIATAQSTADNVIKKYNNVEFTFIASDDTTISNFPCKYTADIEGITLDNVADVYFSALQIPLEIFSSYVLVEAGKVSIFATTSVNYPTSVTVPTVRIS